MPVSKTEDLSSIPITHTEEGESLLLQSCPLTAAQARWRVQEHIHTTLMSVQDHIHTTLMSVQEHIRTTLMSVQVAAEQHWHAGHTRDSIIMSEALERA